MRKSAFPGKFYLLSSIFCLLFCLSAGAFAEDNSPAYVVPQAAWGPYAHTHGGPCYLADRAHSQLFSFPIVIGQRRTELILQPQKSKAGKVHLLPQQCVIERRAFGLSPVQAQNDDKPDAKTRTFNRRAFVQAADANRSLWSARIAFAPARMAQAVGSPPDPQGHFPSASEWGAGAATVECFPAFSEPNGDGLLIRVTLANYSKAPQTYFVDLLGGMDKAGEFFAPNDLSVWAGAKAGGAGSLIHHARSIPYFALLSDIASPSHLAGTTKKQDNKDGDEAASESGQAVFPVRSFHVTDAYFAPESAVTQKDPNGFIQPAGITADETGGWALTRADDITLPPNASLTFYFCVGIGTDVEKARDSAQLLLSLANDTEVPGKHKNDKPEIQPGAYSRMLSNLSKTLFLSGNDALNRLMAQSIANIPFNRDEPAGIATRENPALAAYLPAEGGMIGLGWSYYRAGTALGQIAAWMPRATKPYQHVPEPPAAVPTNLFAAWDIYQRAHEEKLLIYFYPMARHRYWDFLDAGSVKSAPGLFAWPGYARPEAAFTSQILCPSDDPKNKPIYAPEYSAYVLCAARILRMMAEELKRPQAEIDRYTHDMEAAVKALNESLWDAKRGLYTSKKEGALETAFPDSLYGLLPLMGGEDAQTPEQRALLLKNLTDPNAFWSDNGLRTVAKSSAGYQADSPERGAIHIGLNWLLWKSLLDVGETETARKLADNLLKAYAGAHFQTGGCPEWLNGDTGAGGGALDYSGDACGLFPLFAAYHAFGNVATGWDTDIRDTNYDANADTLRVTFQARSRSGKSALVCVMGKPKTQYILSGSLSGTVTSDASGVVTLSPPPDKTIRQFVLKPADAPQ